MSRRFTEDRRLERERLLAAWLRREEMTEVRFLMLPAAEHKKAVASAEASGILIPRTEPGFLYHGTSAARVERIRDEGLLQNAPSIWAKGEVALHVQDRVFFCDTVGKGLWYARMMSQERPGLLRLRAEHLPDARPDMKDSGGSFFVERPVPPQLLEAWSAEGWEPLAPGADLAPAGDGAAEDETSKSMEPV